MLLKQSENDYPTCKMYKLNHGVSRDVFIIKLPARHVREHSDGQYLLLFVYNLQNKKNALKNENNDINRNYHIYFVLVTITPSLLLPASFAKNCNRKIPAHSYRRGSDVYKIRAI